MKKIFKKNQIYLCLLKKYQALSLSLETGNFRFFKNGDENEIYFDVSISLSENNLYLSLKTPIEVVIYSTTYEFSFIGKDFHNLSFAKSKSIQISDFWWSHSLLSKDLFYHISHYHTEKIKFGIMRNYPDSYFSLSETDKKIFTEKCKELFDYAASNKVVSKLEPNENFSSIIDNMSHNYNYSSRYGRRMSNRFLNYKYEYGSNQYRRKRDTLGYLYLLIVVLIFILIFIFKALSN